MLGYQFDLTGGTMGPLSITINYAGDAYSNTPQFLRPLRSITRSRV